MQKNSAITAATNLAKLRLAAQIAGGAKENGYEPLALKGIAMLGAEYPGTGERYMQDIDLLVRRSGVGQCLNHLRAIGGRVEELSNEGRGDNFHHMVIIELGALPIIVEIHTGFFYDVWYDFDYESVFRQARTHPHPELAAAGLRRPCAAHMLLHLAVHRWKHAFEPGGRDVEAAARILAGARLDDELLVRQARQWRLCGVLHLLLRDVAALDAGVPGTEQAAGLLAKLETAQPAGPRLMLGGLLARGKWADFGDPRALASKLKILLVYLLIYDRPWSALWNALRAAAGKLRGRCRPAS